MKVPFLFAHANNAGTPAQFLTKPFENLHMLPFRSS